MHAFGLLTSASTLAELDQMLLSCTVLFSSPCSSENVEKHFRNLQTMLTAFGASPVNDSSIVAEDFEHRIQTEKWKQRKRKKRGVYARTIKKPFNLRSTQTSTVTSSTRKSVGSKTPVAADDRKHQDRTKKK
ncbi:hypothetical protein AOLI_G00325120 [Acnodon oligacanthus]